MGIALCDLRDPADLRYPTDMLLVLLLACGGDIGVTKVATPPVIQILSPVNGETVTEGDAVVFTATVTDRLSTPDELGIAWESSIDGLLSDAPLGDDGRTSFGIATLDIGRHAITLTATDLDADVAVAAIALDVVPLAEVPTVSFVRPLPGETRQEGESVEISVQVGDADGDVTALLVSISSDQDGEVCVPLPDDLGVAVCDVVLSVGTHVLTAAVLDVAGNSAEAEALLQIIDSDEIDDDGDGYTESEGDCDDVDPAVGPEATELCNGVDDDCDTVVDEGDALDAGDWYRDGDLDGYGDPDAALAACDAPADYVADSSDCDDGDDGTSPGAPERCDGVDQDCDGAADNGVLLTWYLDLDGDRYGDSSTTATACTVPADYVALGDDCDDDDFSSNPGGVEVCDGADQDCDGTVDEGVLLTWYIDADGDGHGDPSFTTEACDAPPGYVVLDDDCDDTNGSRNCPEW